MRRGTLEPAAGLDVARALGSAAATILLFRFLPPIPVWAAIPLCAAAFTVASAALGLVNRADLGMLLQLVRRRVESPSRTEGSTRADAPE
jgi:hypothetical protein